MSKKISMTMTEMAVYEAEVEVTEALLDAAKEKGYERTVDGLREAIYHNDLDEEVNVPVVEERMNFAYVVERDVIAAEVIGAEG